MRVLLETDRLVLLRFTGGDVDNVVELDSDPEVMRYLTGGTPTPREVVREDIIPRWLAYYERYDGYGFWAVSRNRAGSPAGLRGDDGGQHRLPAGPGEGGLALYPHQSTRTGLSGSPATSTERWSTR